MHVVTVTFVGRTFFSVRIAQPVVVTGVQGNAPTPRDRVLATKYGSLVGT